MEKKQTKFGRRRTRFLLPRGSGPPANGKTDSSTPPRRASVPHAYRRARVPTLTFYPVESSRYRIPGALFVILFATSDRLRVPPRPTCVPSPAPYTVHESDSLHVALRYVRVCPCASLERFDCFPLFLIPFTVFFSFPLHFSPRTRIVRVPFNRYRVPQNHITVAAAALPPTGVVHYNITVHRGRRPKKPF